jgi:hypothetical protein
MSCWVPTGRRSLRRPIARGIVPADRLWQIVAVGDAKVKVLAPEATTPLLLEKG